MRQLISIVILLGAVSARAFAVGPALDIHVSTPGKIDYYQFIPGSTISVYPTTQTKVSGYVYQQDRWIYNTNGAPISLSGTFTMPAAASYFPFQVIIGSCGQNEPTTALWSKYHTDSILNISAINAQKSTCEAGGLFAGSGMISITPISGYQYPVGDYVLHLSSTGK